MRGTRCAGFAGWLRVVLAIVAVIAVVPAIIVRTAAPASAGTFASAINAVRISPTGSPALCWQAASAATQAAISLQNCDTASNKLQLWNIAADDRVLLNSSTSLCLDNFGNGTSIGAKLQLTDACSSGATHATWPYQLSTTNGAPVGAFFNTFVKLCANDPGAGSSPKAGDQVVRNTCSTAAADEKWSIGSADMAVTNGGNVSGKPGATVSAVLNVSNAGPQDAYLPTLAVSADPGLTIGTLSKTAAASTGLGNCTTSSATVASCAAGGTGWVSSTSGTVQVPVTIPASAKPGTTFQVCGTVSLSPTNDTVPGNNAGCVTVTVTPFESDLAMTTNKSQTSSTTVTPGSTVSVPFTLASNGPDTVGLPVVTFAAPSGFTVTSITPADSSWTCSVSTLKCTGPTEILASGGTAAFTVAGTVAAGLAAGATVGDVTASASLASGSRSQDSVAGNNTATNTLVVTSGIKVDVAKTGAAKADPGGAISYTVTAKNDGPTLVTGATLADPVPSSVTVSSWSCSGAGGATCATSSGSSNSVSTGVSLPPGGAVTITITGTVPTTSAGQTITNAASLTSPNGTTNSGAAVSAVNTSVTAYSDMSVTAKPISVTPGTAGTFSVVLTNNGPGDASAPTTVTLAPPSSTSFGTLPAGCTLTGDGTATCVVDPSKLPSGSSSTLSVQVLVAPQATPSSALTGSVSVANKYDNNSANNTTALTVNTTPASADLRITKTLTSTAPVVPGAAFSYTIQTRNAGPSVATGMAITDTLPAALSYVSSSDGSCSASGQTVTCGPVASVPVNGGSTVTITVRLSPAYTGNGGDIANTATVAASTADPDTSNNSSTVSSVPVAAPSADLSISKQIVGTTPVSPGQTFQYTLTATNAGPSAATNVTVTDTLPAAESFVSSADDCTGTAGQYGGTVTCGSTTPVTLAPGGPKTYTITVRLDPAYKGNGSDVTNTATVRSATADPALSNNIATLTGLPGGAVAGAKADLGITKTVVGSPVISPGQTFTYHIAVTNKGPSIAANPKVTDTLGAGLSFVSSSPSGCTASGQTVTCGQDALQLTGIPQRTQTSVDITVRVASSYTGSGPDLTDTAVVSSDTADPDPSSNTATVTGGVTVKAPSADLSITKAAVGTGPIVPGGSFAYRLTVASNGPSDAKNVVTADALPAGIVYDGYTSNGPGTCSVSGQKVTCTDPTLTAGGNEVYTLNVHLNPAYTGNGSDLGNVATVTSDTADPDLSGNTSGIVYPPGGVTAPSADLSVTKVIATAAKIAPGQTFQYAITVKNAGPSAAVNALVTDTLPAELSYVAGISSLCSASGQTVTCGPVASLAPGGQTTYTVTVRLSPHYSGDGSDISNTATVSSATADPNQSDNTSTVTGVAGGVNPASADLAITKQIVTRSQIAPGQTFRYKLTATNNGPSTAVNAVVKDMLPAQLAFVSSEQGCTGPASYGGTVTCPVIAAMDAGDSKVYAITVRLDPSYTGDGSDIVNTAAVSSSDTADPDMSNNAASIGAAGGVSAPSADLSITKAADGTTPVVPGTTFGYTITAANAGPSTATGVKVTDTLPSQLQFVSSGTGCTASGQTVTCQGTSTTLLPSATQAFTITVRLAPSYAGDGSDITNIATVSAATTDPDMSNNTASAGVPTGKTAPAQADLSITKALASSAAVTPGTTYGYSLTVGNNGPSNAVNPVVTDTLPTGLSYVSSAGGSCSASGQTVTCTPAGTIAAGGSATFTITVQLDTAYTGNGSDLVNTATVSSATADPDQSGNTATAPAPAVGQPSADLGLQKGFSATGPLIPGQTTDVQLIVQNYGPSAASNITVSDPLPAGLAWVSTSRGNCTGTAGEYGGRVTCTTPGTTAVGATPSYVFTVRVSPSFTGTQVTNTATVSSGTADLNTPNNSDSAVLAVAAPGADLALAKTADGTTPVVPGRTFTYTLTATNNGPSTGTGVSVTDALPGPLSFVSSSPSGCTASGQTVTCPVTSSLDPSGKLTYTITVRLDPAYTGDGSGIINTAAVSATTADPDPSNNTATAGVPTGKVAAPSADVSITKALASSAAVAPGTTFGYTITAANSGPSTATGVSVTDTLPGPLSFVSSSPSGCTASGQTVTCPPVSSLAPGGTVTYGLTVKLASAYTGNGSDLTNTASVSSATADPDLSDNTATAPAPVVASASADLVISKQILTTTEVAPGQRFQYKLTAVNNGPSHAVNVVVKDQLPAQLSFVSSDPSGCTASGQAVTCPPVADLADGASTAYAVTVRLDPAYTGDGSDVTNTAMVSSGTADPDPSDNTASVTGVAGGVTAPSADMSITKTLASSAAVTPGSTFGYTVTAANSGPSTATGVRVTDTLPGPLSFVSSSPSGCTASGQTVACPAVGSLAPGGTLQHTITVRLDPAYTGNGSDLVNTASVSSAAADPDLSNNTAAAPAPVVSAASADLVLGKQILTTGKVAPGQRFQYKLTVTNNGPSHAANVIVKDQLPAQLAFVSSDPSGCTASGQAVTCPAVADLADGASTAYTVTVRLDPSYTGDGSDVTNTATVSSGTADPDPSNNTASATGVAGGVMAPSADMSITKTVNGTTAAVPGRTFSYTLSATNNGPSTATGVSVTDQLPSQLQFVSSSPSRCTASGQTVTCPATSPVDPGGTLPYTITVRLDPSYTGDGSDITNTATVSASTADPDLSNNTATAGVPTGKVLAPSADLSVTKVADGTTPAVPGTTFGYALTARNAGPSTATGVSVTDSLPSQLSFVSSADGCAATGQTVTCPAASPLDPGGTLTYRITVRLDPSYTGDGSGIRNTATISATTYDPDLSNNTATAGVPTGSVAGPSADLSITKALASSAAVTPGTTFGYTITATNSGPSTAAGVTVTDTLPASLSFVSSSPSGCTASGQTVTCGPAASLVPGGALTYALAVRLDAAYSGNGSDLVNTATVSSATADPDLSSNTATAPAPAVSAASADLAISKQILTTAKIAPGQTFQYKLTVVNGGPSHAANVVVRDQLPSQLSFVSADPSGCTASGQAVTCPPVADLPDDGSKAYAVTVRLEPAYTGDGTDITNTATVSSDTADPDTANNTASVIGVAGGVSAPSADLSITKVADGTTLVLPGTTFGYTITARNAGPSTATGVSVTDQLPSQLSFVSSADGCTASGQTVTCPVATSLDPGGMLAYRITVRLDPSYTGNGSDVINTAKVTAATADPDLSNNTATAGVPAGKVAAPSADLAISKQILTTAKITPGQRFQYKLTVTNNGPSHAANVVVKDTLPSQLQFVSSSPSGCTSSGQDVTCPPVADLADGATAIYTVTVRLDPSYTGDGSDVVNTATVSADTADPDPSNNTASVTGAAGGVTAPSADLALTKVVNGTTAVAPGRTFTYTLTATNDGPSTATGVAVTDTLPAPLSFVSSSPSDCTVSGQAVTCPATSPLDPSSTLTYTITVRLSPSYEGTGTEIKNTATVSATTSDPDLANNTATAGVPTGVVSPAETDLAITKTFDPGTPGPVTPGTTYGYDLTVTNNGPSNAVTPVVTDKLPTELTYVSATEKDSGQSAACTNTAGTITCNVAATLAVGSSATVLLTVRLDHSYAGDGSGITNTATVSAANNDPDKTNNTASITGVPGGATAPQLDMSVAASTPPTRYIPGDSGYVRVVLTNHGPSATHVPTRVTIAMPADVTAVGSANAAQSGSSMSPGCVRDSATTVTCTAPAEAAGATTTSTSAGLEAQLGLVYERAAAAGRPVAGLRAGDGAGTTSSWNVPFTVSPSAPEHTTLTGGTAILHQPADANPANNEADWTVLTTGAQAALTVTKHASVMTVRAGQQFSYLITVTNRGPSTARNVVVADPLPSALVFVSSPQRCKASGRTVICPNVAVLSPSVSKSFTVVVRVSSSYRGNGSVVNTATARSDAGNSRGSGSATVRASSGSKPEPVRTGGPEPIRSGGAWTGVLPITGFDLRVAEVAMILLLSGGILLITVRRRRRIERGTSR